VLGLPFHHVGIACADLEKAAEFVERAFGSVSDSGTVHDPIQNADVRLFNAGMPTAIELVSGPAVANIASKGMTYYHICYTTPDIEQTLRDAKAAGALIVSKAAPAVLFGGRRVAFVYTDLGLIEFLEESGPK
jgi:methylmalonyl-CoA/ethylmalonyl-CoA epimerase